MMKAAAVILFIAPIFAQQAVRYTGQKGEIPVSVSSGSGQTAAEDQAGAGRFCQSSTGSDTFTCGVTPALTTYTNGMQMAFRPTAAACSGAASINVDSLGAKQLYAPDGTSEPQCQEDRDYWLVYDSSLNAAAGGWKMSTMPVVSASQAIDFGNVTAATCSAATTIATTGAVTGDAVAVGVPAAMNVAFVPVAWVSATDVVSVKLCNISGGDIDPASGTYKVVIGGGGGSGGGGAGASMAAELGDLAVVRTSGTVLTIGTNCSATTPCNVRFGKTVTSITGSATATISAGTGTAYVYVDSTGALFVGDNLTVACSAGCTATAATAFPADTLPVWTWTATAGVWDASGGADKRAMQSQKVVVCGTNMTCTDNGNTTTLDASGGVSTPTLATAGQGFFAPFPINLNADGGAVQVVSSANQTYVWQFTMRGNMTVRNAFINVQTGCTGTCGLKISIYGADCTTKLGSSDVATNGGSPDMTGTGFMTIPWSTPLSLADNTVYHLAVTSDNTTLILYRTWNGSWNIGNMGTGRGVGTKAGGSGTGGSVETPSACTSLSAATNDGKADWPFLYLTP